MGVYALEWPPTYADRPQQVLRRNAPASHRQDNVRSGVRSEKTVLTLQFAKCILLFVFADEPPLTDKFLRVEVEVPNSCTSYLQDVQNCFPGGAINAIRVTDLRIPGVLRTTKKRRHRPIHGRLARVLQVDGRGPRSMSMAIPWKSRKRAPPSKSGTTNVACRTAPTRTPKSNSADSPLSNCHRSMKP